MPFRSSEEIRRGADRSAELARREADRPRPEGRPPASPPPANIPLWGVILWPVAGDAPEGWALCHGQVLDDPHSPLDGMTMPDSQGLVPVGYKSGDADFGTVGGTGGQRSIEIDDHPTHVHDIEVGGEVTISAPNNGTGHVFFTGTPSSGHGVTGGIGLGGTDVIEHAGRAGVTGGSPAPQEGVHAAGVLTVRTLPPFVVWEFIVRVR